MRKVLEYLMMNKRIYLLIVLYIIIMSVLAVLKHVAFSSTAFDLALYDQMIWQFSDFRYDFNTIGGHYPFETHIMLIFFLIVPFYWIYSSPVTLLILQTIIIGLGALPLYWLAAEKFKNKLLATSIAVAYLLNPTLHYINLFDFHPGPLSITFFLFAFYYLEKQKWKLFALFSLLAGLTKEFVPLTIIMLGAYIVIIKRKKIIGAVAAGAGALWFYANIYLSSLGKVVTARYIVNYSYLGDSIVAVLVNIVKNPLLILSHILTLDTAVYATLLFMPGLWLSVLAPEILLIAAPQAALILLHESFSYTEIITHHNSFILPFLFLATIYGIERYRKLAKRFRMPTIVRTKNFIAVAILASTILAYLAYGPFTVLYSADTINPFSAHAKAAREMVSSIPDNASVSAMTWAVPHLNHREEIYIFPNPIYKKGYGKEPWVTEYKGEEVDYILLDLSRKDPLMNESFTEETFTLVLSDEKYGIIAARSGWLLLRNGAAYEQGLCKLKEELYSRFLPQGFKTIPEYCD